MIGLYGSCIFEYKQANVALLNHICMHGLERKLADSNPWFAMMDFYALHLFHERSIMDRNPVGSGDGVLCSFKKQYCSVLFICLINKNWNGL